VSVALLDGAGNVLARAACQLPADRSFGTVTQLIVSNVRQAVADAGCQLGDVTAIGIGSPGNLDCRRGVVISAANLAFKDAPLADAIAQATGRPAYLENDANAAVLAEWWAGAGAGDDIKHLVMFTLGTGVGAGVVSDDRLVRGATGMAGELGHTIIEPCIGQPEQGRFCAGTSTRGVLEQYASARALADRAREALAGAVGKASSLAPLQGTLTSKDVFEHAAAGDALAMRLVDETAEYLAVGFINACRAFDPQLIVVTGGLALAGDALLRPLNEHFLRRWWTIQPPSTCRIVRATTGNDAGTIGAAAAARLRFAEGQTWTLAEGGG